MSGLGQIDTAIWFAIAVALALAGAAVFVLFFHDRKHSDIEQWVEYGFSVHALGKVLGYYRFMALSSAAFYVLFVASLLALQASADLTLFSEGKSHLFAMLVFAFDMVMRGALFDVMEHFDIHLTHLTMNRALPWFVLYCFVFRMFYALTLIKIVISFAWIWGKVRIAEKRHGEQAEHS